MATSLEERSLALLKTSIAQSLRKPERYNSRFKAGALAMRELIAKMYEKNGFVNHAFAIRNTWDQSWGDDPSSFLGKRRKEAKLALKREREQAKEVKEAKK